MAADMAADMAAYMGKFTGERRDWCAFRHSGFLDEQRFIRLNHQTVADTTPSRSSAMRAKHSNGLSVALLRWRDHELWSVQKPSAGCRLLPLERSFEQIQEKSSQRLASHAFGGILLTELSRKTPPKEPFSLPPPPAMCRGSFIYGITLFATAQPARTPVLPPSISPAFRGPRANETRR